MDRHDDDTYRAIMASWRKNVVLLLLPISVDGHCLALVKLNKLGSFS